MTDNNPTVSEESALRSHARGALREQIARILHDANTGRITPDAEDPTKYGAMADALIDAGFSDGGNLKLATMIDEWLDGEPFEVSQARSRAEELPVPDGQGEGFLNGYAAAVSHVEAILEEAAVVPERWEFGWAPHSYSKDMLGSKEEAEKAYYMAVGYPVRHWKRRVRQPNPWVPADE